MSDDQSESFEWRETYFVLFESSRRPLLRKVEQAVRSLGAEYEITTAEADEEGRLESLSVVSHRDHVVIAIAPFRDEVRNEFRRIL